MAYVQLSGQTYKPTLTQEQMNALLQHPSLKGKNPSEVYSYLKSRGYDVQGYQKLQPKPAVTAQTTGSGRKNVWGEEIPEGYGSPTLGFMSSVGQAGLKFAGKTAEFISSAGGLAPNPVSKAIGETTDQMGEDFKEANLQVTGTKPGSAVDVAGELVGEIGMTAGLSAFAGAPKVAGAVSNLASKTLWKGLGSGTIAKALGFGAGSLVETTVYEAGKEARLPTTGEYAWNATFSAMLPLLAGVSSWTLGKGKNALKTIGAFLGTGKKADLSKLEMMGASPEVQSVLNEVAGTDDGKLLKSYIEQAQASMADSKKISPAVNVADDLYEGFIKATDDLKSKGSQIGGLVENATYKVDDAQSLVQSLDDELKGIGIVKSSTGLTPDDFNGSRIEFSDKAKNKLIEVYNSVLDKATRPEGVALKDVWNLKQAVGDLLSFNPNVEKQLSDVGEVPLIGFMEKLDGILSDEKTGIKGLAKLNEEYSALKTVTDYVNKKIGPDGAKGISFANKVLDELDARNREATVVLGGYMDKDILKEAQMVKVAMELAGDTSASSWFGKAVSSAMSPKQSVLGMLDKAVAPNKEDILKRLLEGSPELKKLDQKVLSNIVASILKTLNMQVSSEIDVGEPEVTSQAEQQ